MNCEHKEIIRNTWRQVVPIADTAATLFYQRLFELDPGLARLFDTVDMQQQKKHLVAALTKVVESLDDLDGLARQLESLGRRHVDYGAEPRHYDTVGAALLWTLEQGLGDAFDASVRAAWSDAYALVASCMQSANPAPQRLSMQAGAA